MKIHILFQLIFSLFLIQPVFGFASRSTPGEPPAANPHSPVTEDDKKRVAFGELVIEKLLKTPKTGTNSSETLPPAIKLTLTEGCLKTPSCIDKSAELTNYLNTLKTHYGHVTEARFVHIIPWSFQKFLENKKPKEDEDKETPQPESESSVIREMPVPVTFPDEYMLHSYVRFSSGPEWHHLDIVLTEDASGNIMLRRVFTTPIPQNPVDLPPGVDC